MNEIFNLIIKSIIDSFDIFTSPNLFIMYVLISFSVFRYLAEQAKTTEGKLKMWQYNSYTLYFLFIALQFSIYFRNNPDRWWWALIAIAFLTILLFFKIKYQEKSTKETSTNSN